MEKENDNSPTQFDFFQILNIRGSDDFTEQKTLFKSLEAGNYGEQKGMKYIQEYAPSHWTVLHNVWLRDFDRFECDLILLTRNQIYILEVKNYQGTLLYDNGQCFYNSHETSLNPFEQIRTNHINLKRMCSRVSTSIDIQAAVIFAGDDHEVFMKTPLENIRVLTSNGIRNFILDIVQQEKRGLTEPFEHDKLLRLFQSCEIDNPYQPVPLSGVEMKNIRPGIYCANCQSFNVQITKFKVICPCGLHESREEAIVRTICDYGVLTYGESLTLKDLHAFLDDHVSYTFLENTVKKHFMFLRKGKQNHYINKNLPYNLIRNSFDMKHAAIFYHNDKKIDVF